MDVPHAGKPSEWRLPGTVTLSGQGPRERGHFVVGFGCACLPCFRSPTLAPSLPPYLMCACAAESVEEVQREMTRLKATMADLATFKDPFKFKKGEGGALGSGRVSAASCTPPFASSQEHAHGGHALFPHRCGASLRPNHGAEVRLWGFGGWKLGLDGLGKAARRALGRKEGRGRVCALALIADSPPACPDPFVPRPQGAENSWPQACNRGALRAVRKHHLQPPCSGRNIMIKELQLQPP